MSIQETIKNQKTFKSWLFKTGVGRQLYREWHRLPQVLERLRTQEEPYVYFRYYTPGLTHPSFIKFYKNPPVKWSTRYHARLFYWINYPAFIDKRPFIAESNDHPLAATGKAEPWEVLANIEKAVETYSAQQCKAIILESIGLEKLFRYYLPNELLSKSTIIPALPALPNVVNWDLRAKRIESPTFLFLASDFVNKAVDLLLDAWIEVTERKKSKLILACPNVPEVWRKKAENENVSIIDKAPLEEQEKMELHRKADVVFGLQHVDGGANVIEAMEWGLPVIVLRSHRHEGLLQNNNGIMLDVPYYFYDTEYYGKRWKTFDEFYKILEFDKSQGKFDNTKEDLIKTIQSCILNPVETIEMGKRSLELASNEFSLEKRNKKLRELYQTSLM